MPTEDECASPETCGVCHGCQKRGCRGECGRSAEVEPVIGYYGPVHFTVEEYRAIRREVLARKFADDQAPGDRILAKMLLDTHWRYVDCVRQMSKCEHDAWPCACFNEEEEPR